MALHIKVNQGLDFKYKLPTSNLFYYYSYQCSTLYILLVVRNILFYFLNENTCSFIGEFCNHICHIHDEYCI